MRLRRNNQGDTIVEVLVAIAVASAVLGTAYAIVNRTTRAQQQTTEHTQALKIAESQLELLKTTAASIPTTSFCFNNTTLTTNLNDCKLASPESRYDITITRASAVLSDTKYNIFIVRVSWSRLGSGGNDEVSLTYKVYK